MKFTYYTIGGRNPDLLRSHLRNVRTYAGLEQLSDHELLVIVYRNSKIPAHITEEILRVCQEEGARSFVYDEPSDDFLSNLYACWNLGYEKSSPGYVFRGGCDQVFSKDSMLALYRLAEKHGVGGTIILQANTIENAVALRKIGANSRHITAELGGNFEQFNWKGFEDLVDHLRKPEKDLLDIDDALSIWGHPTNFNSSLGVIDRTDGCSWLMTREDWEKHGPLPPQENGHTGDVIIHDRFERAGYSNFIVRDCITYHFVRGESMEIQK